MKTQCTALRHHSTFKVNQLPHIKKITAEATGKIGWAKDPNRKTEARTENTVLFTEGEKNAGIVPFHICFNIFEIEKKKN